MKGGSTVTIIVDGVAQEFPREKLRRKTYAIETETAISHIDEWYAKDSDKLLRRDSMVNLKSALSAQAAMGG